MAESSLIAQSVFHSMHLAHGATMVESDGWSRPSRYTSTEDEIESVRQGVGITDVSPEGKLRVYSDDLDSFLNEAFRQVTTVATGRTTVRQFTEDSGIKDLLEARLADDEALFINGAEAGTCGRRRTQGGRCRLRALGQRDVGIGGCDSGRPTVTPPSRCSYGDRRRSRVFLGHELRTGQGR